MEEKGCYSSLPNYDFKCEIWNKYIEGKDFNVKGLEASTKYFYNKNDI